KEFKFTSSEKRIDPSFCNPPLASNANAETCSAAPFQGMPLQDFTSIFTYGNDLGIPSGSTMSFRLPDMGAARALFGLNDIPLSITPALGNNRGVEEEDTSFFLQADLRTEIAGMPLRGNVGVRYVKTDQTSWGYSFLSGAAVLIKAERDYTDTLPSLNLALDVTDDTVVRASAAKGMSRPNLGILTPGGGVSVSGNNRTANLGNPSIAPTRAKAYDVSFEWYFAPE